MQWLASVCVKRPVFAAVLMMVIVVVGIAGYANLGLDQFPNIDAPTITVTTRIAGSAPEEVETDVTDRIEEAVSTISGLDDLTSTSAEGISIVMVSFELEKDGDVAAAEVRDNINRVLSQLPDDADTPQVQKIDPSSSPIMYIALGTDKSIVEATEYADKKVKRALQNVSGVGQVSVLGGRARQINVWLDPEALNAYGLTASAVRAAITAENISVPGGSIETGPTDYTLRVKGRVESPEELGSIVVRQDDSHPIRLADVARVEDGAEDQSTIASVNGNQTILLSIRKQSGANTVKVVDSVRERLETVRANLVPGYTLDVVRDNSGLIRTSVNSVKEHLVLGAILASLVVLLFLGSIRSAIVSALAIPVSIIGTFALMWIAGFTLNMITLLALALAVGIVIDDAIIVLENIFRFVREKHMKPFPAALAATKDIGLAVLATTLSLMAVFLPVAFMSGISGRFMSGFGITMAFAIGVSLFVAFSLTPSLSARIVRPPEFDENGHVVPEKPGIHQRAVNIIYRPVEKGYIWLLEKVMRHRWIIAVACVAALLSCVPLMKVVRVSFFPENDEAKFELTMQTPEGTSRESTGLAAERVAADIRRLDGVLRTVVTIGDSSTESSNQASIFVQLSDPDQRSESADDIQARARKEILSRLPAGTRVTPSEDGPGNVVEYIISGPDIDRLGEFAQKAVELMKKEPGAVDVYTSYIRGKPELQVIVDRDKAADLGVRVADVADTLRLLVGGVDVSTFATQGEQFDIRLRADAEFRKDVESLATVTVPSTIHGTVPLRDVVTARESVGLSSIDRDSRQRQVSVTAHADQGYGQNQIQASMNKVMKQLNMPAEYKAYPSGFTQEANRVARSFLIAFALSFIFMYLVLAAQFESWLHPLTILAALPLTIPFALMSILMFNGSLNIFSALGLFVLFGIVKKNSILQIDHINHLRAEGRPRLQAILEGNRDRLRPILMTTIAFVAGVLPLAFSNGIGAGQSQAIAHVIVGGQTLSLLLTLLAIPVIYSWFDDLTEWFKRRFKRGEQVDRGEAEIQ